MAKVKKGPIVALAFGLSLFGLYKAHKAGMLGKAATATAASAELPAPPAAPGAAVLPASGSGFTVRLCGSNTIGSELAPALAEEYLSSLGATGVQKSSSAGSALVSGSVPGQGSLGFEVRGAGTSTAFQEVAAGRCDVAMASREVTPEEMSSLPGLAEHVIGLDGIAVVVAQSSPIASLTVQQLASAFSGTARDWSVFGGTGPLDVVSYDEKSGTYDTFRKLVLGGGQIVPSARKFAASSDVVRAVSSSPSAIGYISLSSARGVKVLAVAEAGLQPVFPTSWTVGRESYPLTRRLYLYDRPGPAAAFVAYALSNAGQAVVSRIGFVDLSVRAEPPVPCPSCPASYVQATYGHQRLSVDFRFQNGRADLDSRGLADVDRVGRFVRPGASVRLIGFADNSGDPAANQRLSLERAERVKAELSRRGVSPVATSGMGSLMPAASNSTPEGKQRNRRVEVWVSL
jgi:phosphate transport system substrate-binding protein